MRIIISTLQMGELRVRGRGLPTAAQWQRRQSDQGPPDLQRSLFLATRLHLPILLGFINSVLWAEFQQRLGLH